MSSTGPRQETPSLSLSVDSEEMLQCGSTGFKDVTHVMSRVDITSVSPCDDLVQGRVNCLFFFSSSLKV